jgi:hypothetical protein
MILLPSFTVVSLRLGNFLQEETATEDALDRRGLIRVLLMFQKDYWQRASKNKKNNMNCCSIVVDLQ